MLSALLSQVAAGRRPAHDDVVALLEPWHGRTEKLLRAAVTEAGTPAERAILEKHAAHPAWGPRVPPHLLEFPTVMGDALWFEDTLPHALELSGWAARHFEALHQPLPRARTAAQQLLADLQAIATEAATTITWLNRLRPRIVPPLHFLRVQALARAELVLGNLRGVRALEVGCDDGALLHHLTAQGADALAVDLEPKIDAPNVLAGDFMRADIPGAFGLIVATAVFEFGSHWQYDRGAAVELLTRLHALTAPGGVVVMENIGYPVPFSESAARQHGFTVLPHRLPGANFISGGRGCTLVRT